MKKSAYPTQRTVGLTAWFLLSMMVFWLAMNAAGMVTAAVMLLVLGLSFVLFRSIGDPFAPDQLTILGFWFITYLLMILLPAFYVYADQEGPYRGRYLFAAASPILTVPFGAWIVSVFTNFRPKETSTFLKSELQPGPIGIIEKRYGFLLVVLLLLTVEYLIELPSVPLFALLQGGFDYRELMFLREESYKLLDSPLLLVHHFVRTVFYPFLVILGLGYVWSKGNTKWRARFIVALACAVFYCSLTLAKAPVSNIFLMLLLMWYYLRGGRVELRTAAGAIVAMLLFPLALFFALFKDLGLGLGDALIAIGERLFYSPAEVVYYYYEVFPAKVGFLHGRSIGRVAWLFGVDYFNTPNFVGQYGYPQYLETINANGAFIADLNADFGLWGVILGGILAGMIMQSLHIYMMRRPRTVTSLAVYTFLVFSFWGLNQASLFYILASNGAVLVLLLGYWFEKESSFFTGMRARTGAAA